MTEHWQDQRTPAFAAEWMDGQGVHIGERWHVDETVVNVDGEPHYLWNVMDVQTRFSLATHISRTRSLGNTRRPLQKATRATADRPTEVLTDGRMAYPLAVSKGFGTMGGPRRGTRIRIATSRASELRNRTTGSSVCTGRRRRGRRSCGRSTRTAGRDDRGGLPGPLKPR